MKIKITNCKRFAFAVVTLLMGTGLLTANTANAQEAKSVANPDKFMIRLGSYYVSRTDTDITVLSSMGAGMTRDSTDFTVDDGDWQGGFTDSHRGALLYGALYF